MTVGAGAAATPVGPAVPGRLATTTVLVREARAEAKGVIALVLQDPDGRDLPPWQPGAHLDLLLPSGRVRPYSLCSDQADLSSYRVAVLRQVAGSGGSVEVHTTQLVGRELTIRGPKNHFELVDADGYLFLAGGIGITPILAMAREVARRARPWRLVYGARNRASMALVPELAELAARSRGEVVLVPQDEDGHPDVEWHVRSCPPDTAVYSCGPEAMMRAVEDVCTGLLGPGRLHLERFASGAPQAGPPERATAGESPFEVELRRSGLVLEVPADRTIRR